MSSCGPELLFTCKAKVVISFQTKTCLSMKEKKKVEETGLLK